MSVCVYTYVHTQRMMISIAKKEKYNYAVVATHKEFTAPPRKYTWTARLRIPLEAGEGLYFRPCSSPKQFLSPDESLSLTNDVCGAPSCEGNTPHPTGARPSPQVHAPPQGAFPIWTEPLPSPFLHTVRVGSSAPHSVSLVQRSHLLLL